MTSELEDARIARKGRIWAVAAFLMAHAPIVALFGFFCLAPIGAIWLGAGGAASALVAGRVAPRLAFVSRAQAAFGGAAAGIVSLLTGLTATVAVRAALVLIVTGPSGEWLGPGVVFAVCAVVLGGIPAAAAGALWGLAIAAGSEPPAGGRR